MKPRKGKLFRTHHVAAYLSALTCLSLLTPMAGRAAADAAPEKKSKVVEIKILPLDAAAAAKVSYARQIKPLFVDNCLECHSTEDRKGGLDATSIASLLKGGKKSGAAIIPGKPDESPMILYVRGLKEPQMPKGSPPLSEQEVHLLREWISAGARDDSAEVAVADDISAKSLRALDPKSLAVQDNPLAQKALNILLFSDNAEDKLLAQRTLRLAAVPKAPEPPKAHGPVLNEIDRFITASWEKAGLKEANQPPALCSDAAFLRRVYLDVIGVIPTVIEAKKFLEDRTADKRTRLVDALLARTNDYAAHWTPFWEEAIGSANVDKVGGIASRGNHRDWIFKSFAENKPYDLMVAELIDPALPGYRKPIISEANGKRVVAAYIRNETHLDTIQSAANVAQVFMGTGMKCASCHSHFLNKEWPQARFLAFAGMFAPKDLELIRCEKPSGQFIPAKFPFDLPGVPSAAPKELDERLHRVAQLLIDPANPRFAHTIVNRLWKRYLGLGLIEPQDDFRLDRTPSQPELLDWLADDFMRHGYDLKHTIRLILTSRTYQLRYDPQLEDHFDVNKTEQVARYYRSPSLRRLTAEQLLDSINVAVQQRLEPEKRTYLDKASTALTRALGRPASHNEISTARSDDVAVVQALQLLNGEEFYERIYSGSGPDQVNALSDLGKVVDALYWLALSRPAADSERELGAKFMKASTPGLKPAPGPAVEQVWLDDDVPAGGELDGTGGSEAWKWTTKAEGPVFSGTHSHTQGGKGKERQHFVIGATQPMRVEPDDLLFTYAYLDPKTRPREIMLQWNDGTWEHRAFWGDDLLKFGEAETTSRRRAGPLPKSADWVRLEIRAREVGFTKATEVSGISFDQVGGTVFWDKSGVLKMPANENREPIGDTLWALFVSPEFQYIH